MAAVTLSLGPLAPPGCVIWRSGIKWLCRDGQSCRAGEVIAYCNIGIAPADRPAHTLEPFAHEARDFQAAFVLAAGGQVRHAAQSSLGGFLDQLNHYQTWDPDFFLGTLLPDDAAQDVAVPLRLLLAAGRRVSEHAEVRAALLTGWHDRSRAWWADGSAVEGTLLSLGSCEATAAIRGERNDLTEMLVALRRPAQVALVPDDILVPCARVVREQVARTPQQIADMTADIAATFPLASPTTAPADWIFAGALLSALTRSPLTDETHVLTRAGLQRIARPDAVVMSLIAEPRRVFRHRRLGYALSLHDYRIMESSPAIRGWLRAQFEPLERGPDDIRRDYELLLDALPEPGIHLLILNQMSSSGYEDFLSYAQFDAPMARTVGTVNAKEMNLMLYDLAAARDVAIVDVDAIAADMGASRHLPDGVHQSGPLQAAVRSEILDILSRRQVPGFVGAQLR
jgi:hypothetical protein